MRLRLAEDQEVMGADEGEVGEFAYDYVELTRDVVYGVSPGGIEDGASFDEAKFGGSVGSEKNNRVVNVQQKFDGYGSNMGRRVSE